MSRIAQTRQGLSTAPSAAMNAASKNRRGPVANTPRKPVDEDVETDTDLDDEDDDDDADELPIDPLASVAGPSAEELPAEEAPPATADDYAGGPDDALGLYLRQMGQIKLLKGPEEKTLAEALERNRMRPSARPPCTAPTLTARATTVLEKSRDGLAAIDPLIDVYSTEEMKLSRG